MTVLLLIAWALFANTPSDLAEPWSGWFIALIIAAVADLS